MMSERYAMSDDVNVTRLKDKEKENTKSTLIMDIITRKN